MAMACLLWLTAMCGGQESQSGEPLTFFIPAQGNSWVWDQRGAGRQGGWVEQERGLIGKDGIARWSHPATVVATWFRTAAGGELKVGLRARSVSGTSVMKIRYGSQEHSITIPEGREFKDLPVVTFRVKEPGYHRLELQGVTREGSVFAEVAGVLAGGEAAAGKVWFVKDEFYWGQRGPSVHLSYTVPPEAGDIRWFYNEVTIPLGEDVVGSYFMANGFAEGYFGIQVNSAAERRVLFSVWSPYTTDDPREIPEEQRIRLLRKGEGVTTGEFGNEGSGGQSYLVYPWKAGVTYSFLLEAIPETGQGSTRYTAWFKEKGNEGWRLIASFSRPQTTTWVKRPHSFLENFIPQSGQYTRKGHYGNQWVCNREGKWFEMTEARFTVDNTGRKEARMDYSGGVEQGLFYLKNCGFFDETTPADSRFTRPASGQAPVIEAGQLP